MNRFMDNFDNFDEYIDSIVETELNNGVKKHISKIDDQINFRYNSFNICIGPQGASKTTSVMKELMKLSYVPNDYHMIIYVTNNDSDDSFNSLLKYVNIKCVKTDYEHFDKQFESLIKLKDEYNKMVDGKIEPDEGILEALCVDEVGFQWETAKKRLHTFILFDDASFIFNKNSKSKFKNWICQCRHLNITAFCCIQIWGSLDPQLKSQLSGVYLFKGFSRERLRYIFNQLPLDENFERFYQVYMQLPKYKKIIVDFQSNSYKIA